MVCGPNEISIVITCPCSGFASAENGKLFLVRMRGGREIERMNLGPLFDKMDYPATDGVGSMGYLQRWPVADSD